MMPITGPRIATTRATCEKNTVSPPWFCRHRADPCGTRDERPDDRRRNMRGLRVTDSSAPAVARPLTLPLSHKGRGDSAEMPSIACDATELGILAAPRPIKRNSCDARHGSGAGIGSSCGSAVDRPPSRGHSHGDLERRGGALPPLRRSGSRRDAQ
jgi:hypothetical protein